MRQVVRASCSLFTSSEQDARTPSSPSRDEKLITHYLLLITHYSLLIQQWGNNGQF